MKRTILNDVLSRRPAVPLYHYTQQTGLLGIIRERQIWATHSQYLNDRREYMHALELVDTELNDLLNSAEGHRKTVLEGMKAGIRGIESMNVCLCSFSEDGDSLSQWRAYGGRSGFSIGFTPDTIVAAVDDLEWYLAPCIYDEADQKGVMRALVEETLEQNIEGANAAEDRDEGAELPTGYWRDRGGSLPAYLHRYAPILKHPSFREEREWRIISRPLMNSSKAFDFREGNSLLVPYYKFPLCTEHSPFSVHEVVIGPAPDQERSKSSARSLLVRHDLESALVRVSSVPFRNW